MENASYQIPSNWAWTTLGEAFIIVLGQSPPSSTYNEDGVGLPFFQGKAEFSEIYPEIRKWCSVPKKIAEKGDVLLSVRAPVGPTNLNPQRSCIGRGLAAIRGVEGVQPLFILYLLRTFENTLQYFITGTTFAAITGKRLEKISIPFPPLNEQVRIVARVEELFSRLDAGIRSLQAAQTRLEQYRQATLRQAYTGKLTQKWRQKASDLTFPDISTLLHQRKGIKPFTNDELANLRILPDNWCWTKIGIIYELIGGGTPSTSEPSYWNGTIPWITSADISDNNEIEKIRRYITEKGVKNSATNIVPPNTVLVVTRVGLGKVALTKQLTSYNQDIQGLIAKMNVVIPEYTSYYLTDAANIFKYKNQGTTISGIPKKQLQELEFPIAPIKEQQNIVNILDEIKYKLDRIKIIINKELNQSQIIKQSILQKAFEGKLVLQDTNDEPARVLLERIKAQRLKQMRLL